jgi:hypothetical protein
MLKYPSTGGGNGADGIVGKHALRLPPTESSRSKVVRRKVPGIEDAEVSTGGSAVDGICDLQMTAV